MHGLSLRTAVTPCLVLSIAVSDARAQSMAIDTIAMRIDTRVLAHDSMGGRGLGSEGARRAAAYIAQRLRSIGLSPAAADGFLHDVPVRATTLGADARIVLSAGADSVAFDSRDFVYGRGAGLAFADFAGPALFAGTAESASAVLAGIDVAGRVIVIAGTLAEDADAWIRHLIAARASALIQLVPDAEYLDGYRAVLGTRRLWVDRDVDEPRWQPRLPILTAGPAMTQAILDRVPIDDAALRGRLDRPVPLGWHVAARTAAATQHVNASNVIGVLPGSDPARQSVEVLFTAHYDHLGIVPGLADSVFNGFSDNAAGVAMLLAIAQALHDHPPPGTVAFAFMTGEESGLLGSSFFAAAPPFAIDRLGAVINLDGGAPPRPPVSWRIAGDTTAALSARAAAIVRAHGWLPVITGTRANSDHWPFLARGIPAIFIIPGNDWEKTSTAERDALRAEFDRYHQPDDAWRADFPFAGLARYAAIALEIGRAIAGSH